MRKWITIFILTVAIILMANLPVYAVAIASEESADVEELDVKGGRIEGKYAEFYFIVPNSWGNFLIAERAVPKPNSIIKEKITFYFPVKDSSPVFMMSLFVFDSINWNDNYPYTKILETRKYVFATDTAKDNPLENKTDRSLYSMFLKNMQSPAFMNDQIILFADDGMILKNTLTLNGVPLKGKSIIVSGVVYLPVREICEFIGYKVSYIKDRNAISISNSAGYYRLFLIRGGSINEGISVILDNDRAYVSNIYFLRDLKVNMDIDEYNNVNMRH